MGGRCRISFNNTLYRCGGGPERLPKMPLLLCIAALCCVFSASSEGSSHGGGAQQGDETASSYVCSYSRKELEDIGIFGAGAAAERNLAAQCAIGAVGGAAAGSKFFGVAGAAAGAGIGCYVSLKSGAFQHYTSAIDSFFNLSPTPLDKCNASCEDRQARGEGPGGYCKEVKE